MSRKVFVFIGDLHGQYSKLQSLWGHTSRLLAALRSDGPAGGPRDIQANVWFLGDYCDRGPCTREVLDMLITLPAQHPEHTFKFLRGNHDHAFEMYLNDAEADLSVTCQGYVSHKPNTTLYDGPGWETMHLQGRRWGGTMNGAADSIYQAAATFSSYEAPYSSRRELRAAVPSTHSAFLRSLVNIIDEPDTEFGRIIATHAGLEEQEKEPLEREMDVLRSGSNHLAWLEGICGRQNVTELPKALRESAEPMWLVSGHHGKFSVNGRRIIVDACGGDSARPLGCVVLAGADLVSEELLRTFERDTSASGNDCEMSVLNCLIDPSSTLISLLSTE